MADGTERPRETILDEANRIVNGQRREDYGGPFESFSDIAKGWSMVLGAEVTPEQVGLCMIQLKVARAKNGGFHRDSFVDIAGYAQCMEFVADHRALEAETARLGDRRQVFAHDEFPRVCERLERSDGKGTESAWVVYDSYDKALIGTECPLNHSTIERSRA